LPIKVLVTGATGFVGTWIVEAWLAGGHDVRALVRDRQKAADILDPTVEVITGDATDPATMDRALEGQDVIVHGAAAYRYGRGLGDEMQRTAPLLARTAFEAAKRSGTSHVIDISSGIVFAPHLDKARGLVTDIDSPGWPRDDIRWRDPYLASKTLAYEVTERARGEGMLISSVHPALIVGPRDRGPGVSGTLLRSLLVDRLIPDAAIPWVDVRDIADIVVAVGALPPGERYLAVGATLTLRETAKVVGRVTGTSRRHLWTAPAMVRAMASFNDVTGGRIMPALPHRPSVEFLLGDKGLVDGSSGAAALGRVYRPFEETVRDAVSWWAANGLLTPAQAGLAASRT
jgi:nucleoside-diphosphate-sugar epimerase